MFAFLRCVAEAVTEHGVRGLVSMVPGGEYLCNVAEYAWKKYRDRKKDAEVREEIQQLAQASFEEVRQAAAEAVRSAAPAALAEDRLNLEIYLSQVPGAVRQSLTRPDDITGKTVPPTFALTTPADLLKLLPGSLSRFRPGDAIPRLPGWALVRPLGTGGFGEVWLAQNRTNESERGAVKFCPDRHAAELQHEGKLIGRVMAAGPHPNIVPLLAANLEGESPWLLYEYVPGVTLADWIRALQFRPTDERVRQAVLALRQLCPAVAHFHLLRPPIVHRDLKPSNILVDRVSKRVKVTDFGIGAVAARAALAEGVTVTTTAARDASFLRGAHTPLYSSPQQRKGEDPDPRDDIHALGVIAYQLLTGQLTQAPGTDFGHDLRAVGVDAGLIALIGECVAQNPVRRPADAGELLRRVEVLSSAPARNDDFAPVAHPVVTPSAPPPPTTRADRHTARTKAVSRSLAHDAPIPLRRRKQGGPSAVTVGIVAGVGLVVLISLGGVLWKLSRSEPADTAAAGTGQPEPGSGPAGGSPPAVASRPKTTATPSPASRPRAPSPLAPEIDRGNPVVPPNVASPTVPFAPPNAASPPLPSAEAALDGHVRASKDPDLATRTKGVEGLSAFLTNPDVLLRRRAAQALADMGGNAGPAAAALEAAVKDPDVEVRREARRALDGIAEAVAASRVVQNRAAILALAKDLQAKDAAKRLKALQQIGGYGTEANIAGEELITAMADPVPTVRAAASEALEKVNPKVHPHVLTLMYGMNKTGAVAELAKLGPDAAIAVPLLLYYHNNPQLLGGVLPWETNLFPTVAKIAPRDRRFASAVLAGISRPVAKGVTPLNSPRVAGLAQLDVIDATSADKLKALLTALGDGQLAAEVITSIGNLRRDAEPALPVLKQLKLSPDDAIRKAATEAVKKIE
jgi:serine/threonine protein kinase/HEAT repeat protein